MPTDVSAKESGPYPTGVEDLVEVKFDVEGDTPKGVIRTDSQQRKKIVFPSGEQPALAALGRRRPYDRERWVCRVLRDSDPHNKRRGALYVTLVTPKHLVFPLQTAGRLHVPEQSLKRLSAFPGLTELLQEIAGSLVPPPKRTNASITVEFGRTVGADTRIIAPRIGYDEPALFVWRSGWFHPSRVIQNAVLRGSPTSLATVWLVPDPDSDDHWRLIDAVFGPHAPREPWIYYGKSEEAFERSMAYWDRHAYLYDPAMGAVLPASWRDAVERYALLRRRFLHEGGIAA